MDAKDYLTISQAARLLGVSRTLVYRAIKDGKLSPVKSELYRRGGIRIPRAQVLLLLPKPPA